MAKFYEPRRVQSLIGTIAQLENNLCGKYMRILNKAPNISRNSRKIVLFFIILVIPLNSIIVAHNTLGINTKGTQDDSLVSMKNNTRVESINNDNQIGNNTLDIKALYEYVGSLYQEEKGFLETNEGFATSTATYEALSILRFFGLDYYQFGSDWEEKEVSLSDNLLNLRDKAGSGGFYLGSDPEAQILSLEGTFGVTTSLWIMNELPLKLKPITPELLDFVINTTFDYEEFGFHEYGQVDCSIKATFEALTILDLSRKTVIIPELIDVEKTPLVNETVLGFMTDYSVNIVEFLGSSWESDSYFNSHSPFQSKIEDTWYALQSIKILEQFGNLLDISLPNNLDDFKEGVLNWLKSLKKTTGVTKGGFGTSEYATVTETGITYNIFRLFNATEEIKDTQSDTISFIYSSQFLKRENRTYRRSELPHIGGFGPNNLTYHDSEKSKQVNIHSTYYAALTLLLSGDIFNSIDLSLETTHYQEIVQEYPNSMNKTNYIIQGKPAIIEQYFEIYNYKSHGSLELNTAVDNWNFSHPDYTENNPNFYGKSNALYVVDLVQDLQADFNWTLGPHKLTNMLIIRNLPVIEPQVYYCNSTLFVGVDPKIKFGSQDIKPGDNVNVTIFYQNRSVPDLSINNVTDGTVSTILESPDEKNQTWFELKPINTTIGAINYEWNVSDQALLGTWTLFTTFNQSKFEIIFINQIEVIDTVILDNISSMPQYYPGENMNLNVSLKYSNGNFTTNANASVVFTSNETQKEVFNLTLQYLQGTIYTTRGINCPTRFLYGFYNISVRLVWNSSLKSTTDSISNTSFPVISIGGIPTISNASFQTDYRSQRLLEENNFLYYGETINFTLMIGFKSNSIIYNVTDERVVVKGGFTNITQPSSFIQLFQTSRSNKSLFLSGLINSNLPNVTFGTRFSILSEWNNSYVSLRNPLNPVRNAAYNFSLIGTFKIKDIIYVATEMSNGLYCYALDTTSVISISFKIINTGLNDHEIPVPNLNLYGLLDVQDKSGTLNQSLPSIISAVDQNGTAIYILSIPTSNLDQNDYEILVYSWSAIKNHLFIGRLSPGFKIIKTRFPQPIFQLHEVLILLTGLTFILLAYLNLKKFR
ncbi:MAG: hypothetical protein ACFFAE_04160 [Candidatus Hodarchaeota archaeon]